MSTCTEHACQDGLDTLLFSNMKVLLPSPLVKRPKKRFPCISFHGFFPHHSIHLFIFGCTGSSIACRGFSSWGERELLFVVVCGVLLLRRTGSGHEGFSSCDTGALLLQGMWNLPRPGIKPMNPTLAGGLLTTEQPEKPNISYFLFICRFSLG